MDNKLVSKQLLNSEGIPTQRNTVWRQSQISKILESRIYTGQQIQNKTRTIDINRGTIVDVPEKDWIITYREELKIIDQELFDLVQIEKQRRSEEFGEIVSKSRMIQDEAGEQVLVTTRELHRGHGRHSNTHLYSNLLRCSNCRSSLRRRKRNLRQSTEYEWSCSLYDKLGKTACEHRNAVSEKYLDEYVWQEIVRHREQGGLDWYLNNYIEAQFDTKNAAEEIKKLDEEIKKVENKIDLNFDLYSEQGISKEQYIRRNESLEAELQQLRSSRNRLLYVEQEIDRLKLKYEEFVQFLNNVQRDELTNANLRKLISGIYVQTVDDEMVGFFLESTDIKEDELSLELILQNKTVLIEWNFIDQKEDEVMDQIVKKDMERYEREKQQSAPAPAL